MAVAPRMGAWIETKKRTNDKIVNKSRPAWARGLKRPNNGNENTRVVVAPRMGAWIETIDLNMENKVIFGRAPHGRVD